MLIAFLFTTLLVVLSTFTHYEVLRFLSVYVPRIRIRARARLLAVIIGTFFGHMLEITFYALAYYFLKDHFDVGYFGGHFVDTFSSYLYFSAETYTTIGLGDIYPLGPLRMITGVEALSGLLLIGWSASFTYLSMQKFWSIRERE
jgi:Ion channel